MDGNIVVRRKAHCALSVALQEAGLPPDYLLPPSMDDHEDLLVVSDTHVMWCQDKRLRADIYFLGDLTGTVMGDDSGKLGNSRDFYPADYGLDKAFRLPFNIAEAADFDAWATLPLLPQRRKAKRHFTMKGSLS